MKRFLVTIFVGFVLLVPVVSYAQLVPCNGPECQVCHFVQLGNNIITWLIGIMASICAIVVIVAGFKMVMAGGNPGELSSAKSLITNAIIGFIILLAAWLIVDTVLKVFLSGSAQGTGAAQIPGFGPWNQIQCVTAPTQPPQTAPVGGPVVTPPATGGACVSGPCVALTTPCTNGCTVDSSIQARVNAFHAAVVAAGVTGTRVTEAMPPSTVHQATCHQNGTCVDYSKSGGMTAAEINAVANAARANGLRPVYEVRTAAERTALINAGAEPGNIIVVAAITAPHFSIYGS